jgi:hypothetical protein
MCIAGAAGEIGVYFGSYFAVLAATARPHEPLFACDIFVNELEQFTRAPPTEVCLPPIG